MTPETIEILLIEDNPADIDLTRETLELARIRNRLHVARDGIEALAYLRQEGKLADAIRPDLILLDLNMPLKDGREVLAELKGDPDLCTIPVVVLTSSNAEKDVVGTYDLGANCYITKPIDLDQFADVVKAIEEFWFLVVRLPNQSDF